MFLRVFAIFCGLFVLGACSSFTCKPLVPEVTIVMPDPDRIRFSGKGAGAGMMLMSSLGPAGIAIGVAIDEGIGKTISATATAEDIDFAQLISDGFRQKLVNYNQHARASQAQIKTARLEIKRYGFVTTKGKDDPVSSEYHIRYQLNEQPWQVFHFPNDVIDHSKKMLHTQPLEQVKTDPESIRFLIDDGLAYLMTKVKLRVKAS